ncbi:MAG TPA: serpin family protein [Candidatus Nitrosotalea sp.]|nr:serpin family protein [Candidatus Nitrosotalea sp.]
MKSWHLAIFAVIILAASVISQNEALGQIGPAFKIISSPLAQFKSGTPVDKIVCFQDLMLVIKTADGYPACVKLPTAQILVKRSWGTISTHQNTLVAQDPSDANNMFALAFLSKISQQDKGNIFFSPYSISNAFSMVYEGAQGATADEMQSVFHFIQDSAARKNYVGQVNSMLNSPSQQYKLNIANALWIQNDYPVLQTYTDTLKQYYMANATNLDLKNDSENSRKIINTWVENKTNQKIVDLLPEGSINENTRVVLTNAIYFKGNWTNQFEAYKTSDQNFTTQNGIIKVPTMTTTTSFPYFEDNTVQALKMPYQGGHLSMIVLLPKDNNLGGLVSSLSVEKLQQLNDNMTTEPVSVYMPKFALDTEYTLNDYLSSMGMPSAFSSNDADFTGITGNKDLSISTAVHQAFVKVDEKGTEAAAATGTTFQTSSMLLTKNTFRADHPFAFMIYDDQTGLILFIGQIVNPLSQ